MCKNNFTEQSHIWKEEVPTQDVFTDIFPIAMSTFSEYGLSFTAFLLWCE